jgi:uncharacterized protein YdeI (YjbR/CyaY-like superfamily)
MGIRDKRVDAYIQKSAGFAQPILTTIRETVHEGCPQVEEAIKWGMPFFMYKGILCSMASFKEHCAFGFWKGSLILESAENKSDEAMGQFGRLKSVKDLPPKKVMLEYLKKAAQLHDQGVTVPTRSAATKSKKELVVPDYFNAALKKNKKASATFEAFSYSKKKDYVQWVSEAKTDETRERRLQTSLEWLSEGKSRNWKYERC